MKPSEFDYRLWCKEDNTYWSFNDEQQRIIPKNDDIWEIELWSGFFDWNGKKIFEGDIIKHRDCELSVFFVKFIHSTWCLINPEFEWYVRDDCVIKLQDLANKNPIVGMEKLNHFLVIGNIHENKELLEKGV